MTLRPTAWCRWAVEAGICWAEKAARWLIPRIPCCTCTKNKTIIGLRMTVFCTSWWLSQVGRLLSYVYGQPAGIFEAHVSAGRKRLVIGWSRRRGHVVPGHKNKSIRGLIYYSKSRWYGQVGRLSYMGSHCFFVIIKIQKVRESFNVR